MDKPWTRASETSLRDCTLPLVLRCDCSFVIALNAQERSSSERGAYEYAFSTRVAAERTERRGRRAPEAARSRTRTRSTCAQPQARAVGERCNGRGAYGRMRTGVVLSADDRQTERITIYNDIWG